MEAWRGKRVRLTTERVSGEKPCLLYVITMDDGENRLSPSMNDELHECLDQILKDLLTQPPTLLSALLLTGTGKYFTLGLDLASYNADPTPQARFHQSYQRLLARILKFPLLTIAAINGHAIAGGMVLALACDFRVMNDAKGLMAMNEIHLPSSIPKGMLSLVQAKVGDPALQRDIFILGKRFTSAQVYQLGLVDSLTTEDTLVMDLAKQLAVQHAHPLRKAPFLEIIKEIQYRQALKDLTEQESFDHFLFAASKQ